METALRRTTRLEQPDVRIMLQPLAAPSGLGSFALGSALIIYGTWFAGAWGTEKDASSFVPFLLLFGGIGQLGAALWSYRARAAASAALHGSWAAFFLGLSLIYLLVTTHTVTAPPRGAEWQSLGQWFIYMSVISGTTAFAALARSVVAFAAQGVLTAGSAFAAAALLMPSASLGHVAGWLFVAAAILAIAVGATLMLLPGGEPAEYGAGDPGVKVGQ